MITVVQGDITRVKADAIVNAANASLLGGSGVDGAIHRAGGSAILDACWAIRDKQGGCKTGEAVITTAGKLPAKFVIHAVGPVWSGGNNDERQLLASAYTNSLRLAAANKVTTIAFPNISTGVYHFPKQQAAAIAVQAVQDFLAANSTISEVIFVCFDADNYSIYKDLLGK